MKYKYCVNVSENVCNPDFNANYQNEYTLIMF